MKIKSIKLGKATKISALAGILIVALSSIAYCHVIYFPQKEKLRVEQQKQELEQKMAREAESKKQVLIDTYNKLATASDSQDWVTLYSFQSQSFRSYVTQDQFVSSEKAWAKKSKIESQQTTVNDVWIDGNNGVIDRTSITCLSKECSGSNRTKSDAKIFFSYINDVWRMSDRKPSERALQAATYVSLNNSSKTLLEKYGHGTSDINFAINNYAVSLDEDNGKLVYVEGWIEKNKAERSRPVVNVQSPDISMPLPVSILQPNYTSSAVSSSKHCTSNTVGDYTYTDCY